MKKILSFMFIFMFIVISPFVCASEIIDIKVLLVNGLEKGNFEISDDGYKGFYYDYLMSIKKDNWNYTFSYVDDGSDYDLLVGTINDTELALNGYYQTKLPVTNRSYMVGFLASNYDLQIDNIENYYNKLIGYDPNEYIIGTTNQTRTVLKEYCKSNGIVNSGVGNDRAEGKITFYETTNLMNDLKNGVVDAVFTYDTIAIDNNLLCGSEIASIALYIKSKNKELIDTIDTNVNALSTLDNGYFDSLENKYFKSLHERGLAFSTEELTLLQSPKTLRVGVLNDYAPYSYVSNSKLYGAITKYISALKRIVPNLNFEYHAYDSMESLERDLNDNKLDINLLQRYYISSDLSNSSSSYFTDKISFFANQDRQGKIAYTTNDLLDYAFTLGYTEDDLVKYNNIEEAMEDYKKGNISGLIESSYAISYYNALYGINDLKCISSSEETAYFAFEYAAEFDQNYKSIISKVMLEIDSKEFSNNISSEIISASMLYQNETFSLNAFIHKYAIGITVTMVSIFAVITLLSVFLIVVLSKSRKKAYRELYVDKLTKGNTRNKLIADAAKLIKIENKYAIVYFDIINFKTINTLFGSNVGDEVIIKLHNKLIDFIPNLDILARSYADRFIALVHFNELDKINAVIDRYASDLYKYLVEEFPDFNVSLRCGIALLNGDDINASIEHASLAANTLQKASGVSYKIYDDDINQKIIKKAEIERDMERALENGEFVAYYQPKVDAITNSVIGAEALVRWNHKEKGLLSPAHFIDIFERNGFIVNVDYYIFEQVCKYIHREISVGRKPIVISSNFSRAHLLSGNFVSRLNNIADKYKVPHEYLEIELTETMSVESFNTYRDIINDIYNAGYKIAIDDFGSGYSSIQLLYSLPISSLKLDASYVRRQATSNLEDSLMQSIINICHEYNIEIICEGVETNEELNYVLKHNCKYIQGYYYSKPLPEEEFRKFKVEK
ncbi:MAG: EAL domain-containing protein [Anaeroplasmataceae bacterium]